MNAQPSGGELQVSRRGRLGLVALNRPKALNALNLDMVEALDVALERWAVDPAVDAVLIRGLGERAFCAGGDVRSIGVLADPGKRRALGRAFFGAEYRANHRINTYPKPFIAPLHGVVMGVGLGVSVHGAYRVVGEDLRMAMPETAPGLFPDVGGSWFLNRCPGAIGRYLALTGPVLGAADALTAGLATHHAPLAAFDAIVAELAAAGRLSPNTVKAVLAARAAAPPAGDLAGRADTIARLFREADRPIDLDFAMNVSDRNEVTADPLRLSDCSLVSDGAAALVRVHRDLLGDTASPSPS